MENKIDWSVYLDSQKPRELLIEMAKDLRLKAGFLNEENIEKWYELIAGMSANEIERRFIFPFQVEANRYSTDVFAKSLVDLYRPVTIPEKFEKLEKEIMSEVFIYDLQSKWQAALPLMQCLSDGEDFETAKAVLAWSYIDTDRKNQVILDIVREFSPRGEEFVSAPNNTRIFYRGIWKPLNLKQTSQSSGRTVSLPHTSYDFAGVPCSPENKFRMLGSVPHDVPPEVKTAEEAYQRGMQALSERKSQSPKSTSEQEDKKLGE